MNERVNGKGLESLLLFGLAFLLLWEWLRPLETLTNTSNVWVFLVFIVGSLLLAYFRAPRLLSAGIKILYVLFVLQHLYYAQFAT